ncbi:MAG: hypothetical protein J6Y92_03365 [Lentisphaeria bacterium]|nr:hypothetical protein [Lentisphaeria bacterium]
MKLRSVIFTAALIFAVGIGFVVAEDAVDENDYREMIDPESGRAAAPGGNSIERYFDHLSDRNGTAGPEKGWISLSGRDFPEAEPAALSVFQAEERLSVYDHAVSFDRIDLDGIGFLGGNDTENAPDTPGEDAESSAKSIVPENGSYLFLVFENKASKDSRNRPRIIADSSYSTGVSKKEDLSRSPYSAPLTILVVTIAICFFLVLFTSTGIKLKD